MEEKKLYWKEVDVDNISIYGKQKNSDKYNKLITFTYITECMPFIQYNGDKFVTLDRMKYLYYRAIGLPNVLQLTEDNPLNYKCLLDNLLQVENDYLKKYPNSKRSKFRRYVMKCEGSLPSKIFTNLMGAFDDQIEQSKHTKYILDNPKKGFMTKIYQLPKEDIKFPYKPAEKSIKKYSRTNKLNKNKTKKFKVLKHSNIL